MSILPGIHCIQSGLIEGPATAYSWEGKVNGTSANPSVSANITATGPWVLIGLAWQCTLETCVLNSISLDSVGMNIVGQGIHGSGSKWMGAAMCILKASPTSKTASAAFAETGLTEVRFMTLSVSNLMNISPIDVEAKASLAVTGQTLTTLDRGHVNGITAAIFHHDQQANAVTWTNLTELYDADMGLNRGGFAAVQGKPGGDVIADNGASDICIVIGVVLR